MIKRQKPGATGKAFFHLQLRPRTDFSTFRIQDVGVRGGIERVAGRRANGSWDTQKWLIAKTLAHIENGTLIADAPEARKVLASLGSRPVHVGGDRFQAMPRRDVPEKEKTHAGAEAGVGSEHQKAQAARRAGRARP